MVGYGGVGILLYCWFGGLEIDWVYDQLVGGGNVFIFDLMVEVIVYGWCVIEEIVQGDFSLYLYVLKFIWLGVEF